MGHTAILIGATALATGLICLFCGYLWGRSNLKIQVEDAVDQVRRSADARQFTLREELDERMLELAELRARAEERPRLPEQSAQMRGSSGSVPAAEVRGNNIQPRQQPSKQKQEPPPVDSTEKTIQNLLKSIEEKSRQPEAAPSVVIPKSTTQAPPKLPVENARAVAPQSAKPAKLPIENARAVAPQNTKPAPARLPASEPTPKVKDEWQEFAASLEALRSRQK